MTYKERIIEILQTQTGERKMQVSKAERIAGVLIANDVVVQNHGKWMKMPGGYQNEICSICTCWGGVDRKGNPIRTVYCPNCGAKMDGDGNG